jgi:hypothetical protein
MEKSNMGKFESIRIVEAEEGEAFDLQVPKGQDKKDFDKYSEAMILQNKVIIELLKQVRDNLEKLNSNRLNSLELISEYLPEFQEDLKYYLNISTHENIEKRGSSKELNPAKEIQEKKAKAKSKPKEETQSKSKEKPKNEAKSEMETKKVNGKECTYINHFQYVRETAKAVCMSYIGENYWFPKSTIHNDITKEKGVEQKLLVENWVLKQKEIL